MPGKMPERQLDNAIDWLRRKTDGACPFCGSHQWTVDDELASVPVYAAGDDSVQVHRGHTLVLVTCEQCGFTAPFAARRIGVE
jgi:hypothetical protein